MADAAEDANRPPTGVVGSAMLLDRGVVGTPAIVTVPCSSAMTSKLVVILQYTYEIE